MSDSDDNGPAFPEEQAPANQSDNGGVSEEEAAQRDADMSDGEEETIAPPQKPVVDNKPNLFASSSEDEDSEQEQEIVDQNDEDEEDTVAANMSDDEDEGEKKSDNEKPAESSTWKTLASDSDSSASDSSDSDDDDAKSTKSAKSVASEKPQEEEDDIDWETYDPDLVDPDASFLPGSPVYEEDTFMHDHERRLNAINMQDEIDAESTVSADETAKRRRYQLDSSDDEEETTAKRPHEQLDDVDENDPFAQPLVEHVPQKDSDSDSGPEPDKGPQEEEDDPSVSYFEKVLSKKKLAAKRKRRRNTDDSSFISEADDLINDLMRQMAEASGEDKQACVNMVPAIAKLRLLPKLEAAFKTRDYHNAFIENGIMTAIADWLAPLPNNALPNLKIRTSLLQTLVDFPHCSIETLKASGVGKAVNRLLQHPKEMKDNKKLCKLLIRRYSKQIFDVKDTGAVSKEDRQQRDLEFLRKYGPSKLSKFQKEKDEKSKKVGELKVHEKGFIMRARVPMPSNRDYLIRPKSNIDPEDWNINFKKGAKRVKTGNEALMDKTSRRLVNMKQRMKQQKSAKVSLSGSKGALF